jgi:hypothetical protein
VERTGEEEALILYKREPKDPAKKKNPDHIYDAQLN